MLLIAISWFFSLWQPLSCSDNGVPPLPAGGVYADSPPVLLSDSTSGNKAPGPACDSLVVRNIQIECHRKTIDRIILREMALKPGSRLCKNTMRKVLEKESSKIFNTNLFVIAEVLHHQVSSDSVDLIVSVIEKWYTYPIPIVDISDRNFSEWFLQRGADLDRLIYGMRFRQQNFRGRNEDLRFWLQLGFIRNMEFDYRVPYIDRQQTIGMNVRVSYSNNKNVAYNTISNQRQFASSEHVLQDRFAASIAFSRRSEFYNTHGIELRFNYNHVKDTIVQLNPEFFMNGSNKQRFFELSYTFVRDLRNRASYPLKGAYTQFKATQKGLGNFDDINQFEMRLQYARFFQLGKRCFLSNSFRGYFSFPTRQPYNEIRSFGYLQNFARGYELYVIDGQRFGIAKNTLRYRLLATEKSLRFTSMEQFRTLPLEIYLKTYYDLAYVSDKRDFAGNRGLANQLLWGAGTGLDLVLYNSFVVRLEYSVNKRLEHGFFFNLKSDL